MGVAEALNHMVLTNKVEALAVVAAPKTLGQLRKHWHKALEERLVGEIPQGPGRPPARPDRRGRQPGLTRLAAPSRKRRQAGLSVSST